MTKEMQVQMVSNELLDTHEALGGALSSDIQARKESGSMPEARSALEACGPGKTHGIKKTKVLLEMRPALDGFAGIPQETRLLFRGLRMIDSVMVEGMIQTSHRVLARGTKDETGLFRRKLSDAKRLNRYSRVIISMAEKPYRTIIDMAADFIEKRLSSTALTFCTLLGAKTIKLTHFQSRYFEDFIWRSLFAKTLPASDFALVTSANQKICATPWHTMHMVGLNTLIASSSPKYPKLDTSGIDVFIAQTPYPARISRNTAFVVRYHDALPVFMPHTIPDKSMHQATHFYALMDNIKSGAYIACVSESTRKDLLTLFPEAHERAVTIHNMVSQHYYLEDSSRERVPDIIRSRLYALEPETKARTGGVDLVPTFLSLREQESFYKRSLREKQFSYLLIVSTVEPRKNHARLLAAWEVVKAEIDPDIKLVIVGSLGWDYSLMIKSFKPWIDRGELFVLNAVPAPDLRVLYRHAAATVCPSLGEGFDFSGVESMRSGGVTIASDIPVHREVYADASEYFDPYSTASLVKALKRVIYSPEAQHVQGELRVRGQQVSSRYLPANILPQWEEFLKKVTATQGK